MSEHTACINDLAHAIGRVKHLEATNTDLLAALKTMVHIHPRDGCVGTECLCNKARDAIAKAELPA